MIPLIIGAQLNEATPRDLNPHVPFSADEIAAAAAECRAAGASVTHYHARGQDGAPDHSPAAYGAVNRAVRAACDILVAPSLANLPGMTATQRLAVITEFEDDPASRPDFVVVDCGCAVMDLYDPQERRFRTEGAVYVNSTATHRELFAAASRWGIPPYPATFNVSWTRALLAYQEMGWCPTPALTAVVLGGPEFLAAHPATVDGLRAQLQFLPAGDAVQWLVSAYRGDLLEVARFAVANGGHVAIGVGDHHYADRGAPSTAELVAEVAGMARAIGRDIATPTEVRELLGPTSTGGVDTAEFQGES